MCPATASSVRNPAMIAASFIGVPYAHGGRDKFGMDCYGLFLAMMREMGRAVADYQYPQGWEFMGGEILLENYHKHAKEIQRADLAPGDAILFRTVPAVAANHIGVYIGAGRFVHCTKTCGVTVSEIDRQPHARRVVMFCKVMGETEQHD